TVRIEEVRAARHVVLGGAVERDAQPLELLIGGLQLLEVVQSPGDVVQAWLGLRRRLSGRLLEQGQIVVLLAEAEEHRAALQIFVGHLQAQGLRVEVARFFGVPDVQYDVAEPLRLDHGVPPRSTDRAPAAILYRGFVPGAQRRGQAPAEPAATACRSRRATPARTRGTRSRPNSIASWNGSKPRISTVVAPA